MGFRHQLGGVLVFRNEVAKGEVARAELGDSARWIDNEDQLPCVPATAPNAAVLLVRPILSHSPVPGEGVMVQISEAKRESLAALCRKYGVVRLYLFGSALREDFRPGESDIDLLVDFGTMDGRRKAHAYFDLLEELQSLFSARVDLVMVGALKNRYIAREVETTKQVLYAA
jgi:uncharacterized protein